MMSECFCTRLPHLLRHMALSIYNVYRMSSSVLFLPSAINTVTRPQQQQQPGAWSLRILTKLEKMA